MAVRDQQRVVVIGVNYGTDDAALRFVRSISKIGVCANANVVIVDNTERDDSSEFFCIIQSENKETACIKAPSNLGYFGGANFGLNKYLRNSAYPDWVIVSNVDIEFRDEAFLAKLRDVNHPENIGVIAPSIWSNRYRRDLNPGLAVRPSKRKMKLLELIYRNFYLLNIYELISATKYILHYIVKYKFLQPASVRLALSWPKSKMTSADVFKDVWRFIYAPHGSCIIFSKLFFLRGGNLKFPAFLFGEEIYVAEMARSLGVHIVYNPQLRVWHDDHSSTGLMRSRKIASYVREAGKFITETYFT